MLNIWLTAQLLITYTNKLWNLKFRETKTLHQNKAFALMYSQYIGFPGDFRTEKRFVSLSLFSDMSNVVFDSFKVIHHSHITGET